MPTEPLTNEQKLIVSTTMKAAYKLKSNIEQSILDLYSDTDVYIRNGKQLALLYESKDAGNQVAILKIRLLEERRGEIMASESLRARVQLSLEALEWLRLHRHSHVRFLVDTLAPWIAERPELKMRYNVDKLKKEKNRSKYRAASD